MLVREQHIFKVKDSGKRRVIHIDKKLVADQMKFEFFNAILDCQNLFVDHMVILFRFFELSACMCTETTNAIYFFKKNGTLVIIAGICLEVRCPVVGILSGGGDRAITFSCLTASVCAGPHGGHCFLSMRDSGLRDCNFRDEITDIINNPEESLVMSNNII